MKRKSLLCLIVLLVVLVVIAAWIYIQPIIKKSKTNDIIKTPVTYESVGIERLTDENVRSVYFDSDNNPDHCGYIDDRDYVSDLLEIMRKGTYEERQRPTVGKEPGSGISPYIVFYTDNSKYTVGTLAGTVFINIDGVVKYYDCSEVYSALNDFFTEIIRRNY